MIIISLYYIYYMQVQGLKLYSVDEEANKLQDKEPLTPCPCLSEIFMKFTQKISLKKTSYYSDTLIDKRFTLSWASFDPSLAAFLYHLIASLMFCLIITLLKEEYDIVFVIPFS